MKRKLLGVLPARQEGESWFKHYYRMNEESLLINSIILEDSSASKKEKKEARARIDMLLDKRLLYGKGIFSSLV